MQFYVKNLKSLIEVTRAEHGVLYVIGVLIGAIMAGWGFSSALVIPIVIGLAVSFLVEIGAFSLNDYLDFKADKINKRKDRPLVRGDVSRETALLLAVVGFVAGNLLALYFINTLFMVFGIVVLFSLVSILYNVFLKNYPLGGNLFIGFSMGIPFIFGGLIVGNLTPAIWIIAGIAFITGFGREIMKDMQDMKGDKAIGSKTFPIVFGKVAATYTMIVSYLIGIGLSIYPMVTFFSDKPIYYLILITDALLLYVIYSMLKSKDQKTLKKGRKLTLYASVIALIVFLATVLI